MPRQHVISYNTTRLLFEIALEAGRRRRRRSAPASPVSYRTSEGELAAFRVPLWPSNTGPSRCHGVNSRAACGLCVRTSLSLSATGGCDLLRGGCDLLWGWVCAGRAALSRCRQCPPPPPPPHPCLTLSRPHVCRVPLLLQVLARLDHHRDFAAAGCVCPCTRWRRRWWWRRVVQEEAVWLAGYGRRFPGWGCERTLRGAADWQEQEQLRCAAL